MVVRIRVAEQGNAAAADSSCNVLISSDSTTATASLKISDLFQTSLSFGPDPENAVKWYIEEYIREPFETAKADNGAEALRAYGRDLAVQISSSSVLPKKGDIEIQILGRGRLQRLHWEVLEDTELWPAEYRFKSVGMFRLPNSEHIQAFTNMKSEETTFRILLVVSRPRNNADIDYQLVSRCLVAISDHVSKMQLKTKISLTILRPQTWLAFREHLHLHDRSYDLVHFDMHGKIQDAGTESARAVLAFSKSSSNPTRLRSDFRTADEVGKELAKASIKTVVLNACESARSLDSSPAGNMAETFLSYGVQSVLAMAYQVTEGTVEIFMNTFYQSLLISRATIQEATRISRLALMRNRSRRDKYMHHVQLLDYLVPVLYTCAGITESRMVEHPDVGSISYLEGLLSSVKKLSPFGRQVADPILSLKNELLGRDTDILSLELLLSACRTVLLHGQGGCGKTALLQYLCRWWKVSGWIKDSIYIDLSGGHSLYDFEDVLILIAERLNTTLPDNKQASLADMVISQLQEGRYLLVFDSADVLGSPVNIDRVTVSSDLQSQLATFIETVTRDQSMVIISSRLDTTNVANVNSNRSKYNLTGLSIINSVDLLQRLASRVAQESSAVQQRRENIDFLRRTAVLLEGNPAAIQFVVPIYRRAGYDGEKLFATLLYGTFEINESELGACRFTRTLLGTLVPSFIDSDKTLIHPADLAVFWTLMPKDLTYYLWFSIRPFFTPPIPEGSFGIWVRQPFKDRVKGSLVADRLRKHWNDIEMKFFHAGILQKAVINKTNGEKLPCYHVNPLYCLFFRSGSNQQLEGSLKEQKSAYVRQLLLWDNPLPSDFSNKFSSVEWEGQLASDDYIHNLRAMALAWSMEGDQQDEIEEGSVPLFYNVYAATSMESLYNSSNQAKLFVPILRDYVFETLMLTTLFRPNGLPTKVDLQAIVNFSWELYRLESDNVRKAAMIDLALDTAQRYKDSGPEYQALPPNVEFTWFQFRHAEADLAQWNDIIDNAKLLYERNLNDDPAPESLAYNAIKRVQMQNLLDWSGCVFKIAVRDGDTDIVGKKNNIIGAFQEMLGGIDANRGLFTQITQNLLKNEAMTESITVRDQLQFAISRESKAGAKFGKLTNKILDGHPFDVYDDLDEFQNHRGKSKAGKMAELLNSVKSDGPGAAETRKRVDELESLLHLFSGNSATASEVLLPTLKREALSSTTSSGWENLADWHMQMHMFAMLQKPQPDYKKGLTHLEGWWTQHQGIGITKRDVCYGHMKFAACYNGLGRVADAARSVLSCMNVIPTMGQGDVAKGDSSEGFKEWVLGVFSNIDKLSIFLDPKIVFGVTEAPELTKQERIAVHQIMKEAYRVKKAKEEGDQAFEKAMRLSRELKELSQQFKVQARSISQDTRPEDDETENEETKKLEALLSRIQRKKENSDGDFFEYLFNE